jgi:hypothetical protein
LFFLTGVEATNQDIVTDREIRLRQYPIVAYLVDGNPCLVRLRNTNNYTVWQMDFCKITGWRWVPGMHGGYRWFGKDAFCISRNWRKDENYTDPDFATISSGCDLERHDFWGPSAYLDRIDIRLYVSKDGFSWLWSWKRPIDRMIASYRYMEWFMERRGAEAVLDAVMGPAPSER